MGVEAKKAALQQSSQLSLSSRCRLLGLSRTGQYYEPVPSSALNLQIMDLIDRHYLDHPDKGPRRMLAYLRRVHGLKVNIKRVNRLYYKVMGLQSLLPGPHTSTPNTSHKVYPYLLRGLLVERPNQVWQTDITVIIMNRGYLYLSAIIDVFSRYVIDWSLSNTMTAEWCTSQYLTACQKWGNPEIINTDQGSQYTSNLFTGSVLSSGQTKLSMDGKGRATDNAFIERLWRSVKYEFVYLHEHTDGRQLNAGLDRYFHYYNNERDHSGIDYNLPRYFYNMRS